MSRLGCGLGGWCFVGVCEYARGYEDEVRDGGRRDGVGGSYTAWGGVGQERERARGTLFVEARAFMWQDGNKGWQGESRKGRVICGLPPLCEDAKRSRTYRLAPRRGSDSDADSDSGCQGPTAHRAILCLCFDTLARPR